MNTKTMRLPPRRILTPNGSTHKRKERDDTWPKPITSTKLHKPEKLIPMPNSEPIKSSLATSSGRGKVVIEPTPSNHLLAGYLAHEYLTKGTLMGQPWAPPQTEGGEKLTCKDEVFNKQGGVAVETPCRRSAEDGKVHEKERYAQVAGLLKDGRSHLPSIMNPTHLVHFLHI
ncbi:hypothetical protein TanjilG_19782 [Lupinus angustifolius]|uniref:Uncharacterized protein n=1 Tax=Lupinus angustifolius TaxID=3871 RepID=A0A1J7H5B3_LUPAN|nr:PREDICTED: uncharacterized protein LOC109359381 [Lupinus angustifolius]OIW01674.1 hypothetical protein TanjilG_19782 [Lupinus angustifolius]